jgi:hypothetical protein
MYLKHAFNFVEAANAGEQKGLQKKRNHKNYFLRSNEQQEVNR